MTKKSYYEIVIKVLIVDPKRKHETVKKEEAYVRLIYNVKIHVISMECVPSRI